MSPLSGSTPACYFLHLPRTPTSAAWSLLARRFPAGTSRWLTDAEALRLGKDLDLGDHHLVGGPFGPWALGTLSYRPVTIAVLSEPVARAVSQYIHLNYLGIEELAKQGAPRGLLRACTESLGDFIEYEPALASLHLGNVQTGLLVQDGPESPYDGEGQLPEKAEAVACERLEQFDVVGLSENPLESRALLCHALDGTPPQQTRHALEPLLPPAVAQLDERTRGLLDELTVQDRALYSFATNLFWQRWRQHAKPLAPPAPAPNGEPVCYRFEQPPEGEGWYGCEWQERLQLFFCWTTQEAWLELPVPAHEELLLRCHVLGAVFQEQIERLEVLVNDYPLPISMRQTKPGVFAETAVPVQVLRRRSGAVKVSLRVPNALRPCDVVAGSQDTRLLGLAICGIELIPLGRHKPRRNRVRAA